MSVISCLPIDDLSLDRITSPFGYRIHPITHTEDYHKGIDFAYAAGTPIKATHDGTAVVSGNNSAGLYVIIRDGEFETHYYHMSKHAIKNGAAVKAGDVIGYVGTTGNSTGNHLHFGLSVNGAFIDPLPVLKEYMEGISMTKTELITALTPEEALSIYRKALIPLHDNDAKAYSEQARAWAVDTGLIEGDGAYNWESPLTREQFVTVLKRYHDLFLTDAASSGPLS